MLENFMVKSHMMFGVDSIKETWQNMLVEVCHE